MLFQFLCFIISGRCRSTSSSRECLVTKVSSPSLKRQVQHCHRPYNKFLFMFYFRPITCCSLSCQGEKYYLRSLSDNPRKEAANLRRDFPQLADDILFPFYSDDTFFSSVLRVASEGLQLWTHYDVGAVVSLSCSSVLTRVVGADHGQPAHSRQRPQARRFVQAIRCSLFISKW